jgi:predicted HTH domain antitoxin
VGQIENKMGSDGVGKRPTFRGIVVQFKSAGCPTTPFKGEMQVDDVITVRLKVPQEWVHDLKDQATLLEILGLGLEEYRFRRALTLYQAGAGSIGYVAELVGIPERVLTEEARQRGVLPEYDEQFTEQDLNR